jgi:hypothetical protein
LVVNDVEVTTAAGLAGALLADWPRSRRLLADASWQQVLSRWVDESGDAGVLEFTAELADSSPDHRVARLASFLDPHRTPAYDGRPLTRVHLRELAARSSHEPPGPSGPEDAEVLRVVLQERLLEAWSSSAGFAALDRIDEAWRTQVDVVLGAPPAVAGRDRPSPAFTRGLLLLDALGELTTVCPVCEQEAADPSTTCRLVQAMAALSERPSGLDASAALLLWGAGRQRQELARRAEQLDEELGRARVDNEPAAVMRRTELARARGWATWGLVSVVVLAAFGWGAGRQGAVIAGVFAVVFALIMRWWLDRHHPKTERPPAPVRLSPSEIILLDAEPTAATTRPEPFAPAEPTVDDPGPALDLTHEDEPATSGPPRTDST